MYTPEQLKDLFRSDVDDQESPGNGDDSDSLWSDDEIYSYMDYAQREFARVTLCFTDSSTTAITQIAVVNGEEWVDIDPRIIDIQRASLVGAQTVITPKKAADLDQGYTTDDYGVRTVSRWETLTGRPRFIVTDMEANRGRLVPIPTEDDVILMTVYRYPLRTVIATTPRLEIVDPLHQLCLLDGMKARAYMKQDADVFNSDMSEMFAGRFRAKLIEIESELRRMRKRRGPIRYGGL